MTRIVLHIDRLVLDGVRAEQRGAIERALVAELQRQLSRPDAAAAWAQLGHVERLRGALAPEARAAARARTAAPVAEAGAPSPAALGRAAARGLAKSVQR